MKRWLLILTLLLAPMAAHGQNATILPFNGVPTGTCPFNFLANDVTNGNLYFCDVSAGGTWSLLGGGGSVAFSAVTAGTNTNALVIGTGGSLTISGSGTINATTLNGATFPAPGAIGGTTPSTGAFTTVTATPSIGVPLSGTGDASSGNLINLNLNGGSAGNGFKVDSAGAGTFASTSTATGFISTDPHTSEVNFTVGASGYNGVTASTVKIQGPSSIQAAGYNIRHAAWGTEPSAAALEIIGAPAAHISTTSFLAASGSATDCVLGNFTIAACPGGAAYDPLDTTVIQLRDEFCGGTNANGAIGFGWSLNLVGTSGVTEAANASAAPNICVARLTTSATTARGGSLSLGTSGNSIMLKALGSTANNWDSKFVFAMSATASTSVYIGFGDTLTAVPPANFIGLRFDTSATSPSADTTNFRFVVCKTSTCTAHGTTYTADANFHKVRIRSTASGQVALTFDANAEICFNSGGTCGCTASANVPTANITAYFEIVQQSGVAQTLDADFFGFSQTGFSR